MSAIGGLIGLGGGQAGTSFQTTNGTNSDQLAGAYNGAQNSLQSQQNLLGALQGQNGLGNQSQVYNQMQGVVNGTGPNPAQAQLAQATGQNVANQAALMAGQRGAASNVGLMARQAAQQGAATQQNAAGQAATLQANQSLNALNSAGSIANTQAANQIGATTANTQAQQSEQGILQGANTAYNTDQAGLANTQMGGQQNLIGGAVNGLGPALGLAGGGVVSKFATGGPTIPVNAASGPQSSFGQFLKGWAQPSAGASNGQQAQQPALQQAGNKIGSGIGKGIKSLLGSGGSGPQAVAGGPSDNSGGGGSTSTDPLSGLAGGTQQFMTAAQGGNVGGKLKSGGHVPGDAPVKGNSYANDNVKALLSPGEGVIDRETMADKGPAGQMARTLMAIVSAKKKSGK